MKYKIGDRVFITQYIDATDISPFGNGLPLAVSIRDVDEDSKTYTVYYAPGGSKKTGVPEDKIYSSREEAVPHTPPEYIAVKEIRDEAARKRNEERRQS